MASIQTIQATDTITSSRADININFANLNSDKIETSYIDTDTTLAANSDVKIPSQKAVKAYIDAGGSDGLTRLLPTGSILPYVGSAAPSYFVLCDGASYSTTTYASLFAVIGYGYGGSGGSFNVPDLKGRFPLGYSASAPTKVFTFVSRSSNTVTVTSDVLSNSTTNELQTGQAVLYSAPSGAMTGLVHNTTYYLIRVAYNQFSLASSLEGANSGTVIALSSDGIGAQTFTATYTARALGDKGGTETDTTVPSHKHTISTYTSTGTGSGNMEVGETSTAPNITYQNAISTVGSVAPSNMPLFTVVNYIIKT